MESDQRQRLIRQRAGVKAQLTRMQTFLDNVDLHQQSNIHEIKLRFEDLTTLLHKYDDIQTELEVDDTGNESEHEQHRTEFENKYYLVRGKMTHIITANEHVIQQSNGSRGSGECKGTIKLPAVTIPSFDGKYENWLPFSDSFKALIHHNNDLAIIQKFHYLTSVIQGTASQTIQNLPITEANYSIAWKLLEDRYENKRLIASTHINNILDLKHMNNESATELTRYSNSFSSNLNALKALNISIPLHEVLLCQLFLRGLDANTRREWELTLKDAQFPSLNELMAFCERKRHALENFPSTVATPSKGNADKRHDSALLRHSLSAISSKCVACMGDHALFKCDQFSSLRLYEKQDLVTANGLCFNCLRPNHSSRECKSHGCRSCNRRHHTLLHGLNQRTTEANKEQQSQTSSRTSHCSTKNANQTRVILSTALVKIADNDGQLHLCRALLDSGSQSNLCTESLAQRLRLPRRRCAIPISGINNSVTEAKYGVQLQLHSTVNEFAIELSCSVLPRITGCMPSSFIDCDNWNLPTDITLADPTFYQPGCIDILIGAEYFFSLLEPCRRIKSSEYPVLQATKLGWVLAGRFPSVNSADRTVTSCVLQEEDNLEATLRRFWELEDIVSHGMTKEELLCEEHFKNNTTRNESGRFIVRLPLRHGIEKLGTSYDQAKSRLVQLEKRLNRQPALRKDYSDFIMEYEALGHMKLVSDKDLGDGEGIYYLPHHPVIKASSTTTKTRVVFDASAKTSSNISLNDLMMIGPRVQDDLFSIILRFRTYTYAFIADVTKMYRQIIVSPEDRRLQRILWRNSPQDPYSCYELTTVTYGTASAPFLATRCLQQLAEDEASRFSRATTVLCKNFYVDDVLSGSHDLEDALKLQSDLITLMHSGGFHLRKWCANHPALLETIPEEDRETQLPLILDRNDGVKSLGLLWHPASDNFLICNRPSPESTSSLTKRKIASIIASIFDPLGLISPVVVLYKVFLQNLWLSGQGWDDILPSDLNSRWKHLYSQLPAIKDIQLNRLVTCHGYPADVQIHGFSDASEQAYGACLYVLSRDHQGNTFVKILCSRSRVAPVKRVTLPRLELCGALLLAQLVHKVLPALELPISKIFLWTDSTIVLSWLAAPANRWKTFVANRVATIQDYTHAADWRHVPTCSNPADLISRGITPTELRNKSLWWNGPAWLQGPSHFWPSNPDLTTDLSEVKENSPVTLLCFTEMEQFLQKYSSLSRLTRVTAYCLRFCKNARNPRSKVEGPLTAHELRAALYVCVRITQQVYFTQDIAELRANKNVSKKSKIVDLHPFIDESNMLRVGGRLDNSKLPFDSKHQIILPSKHHLTELIIKAEHLRLLHAGSQYVISSLRERFWIPSAKAAVRKVIHKCLPCFRLKASASAQLMGQLPITRLQPTRPFLNVGVDYAGPLCIKHGSVRSKVTTKCYISVFICLSTRAVHLEVVSNLSTQAFVAALRRFIARRGKCSIIYSDNGTNFTGADKELHELRRLFLSSNFNNSLQDFAASEGLTWHFIPPSSPHFGGLWEAAVKSMKYHLRRVAGNSVLTFEELSTLVSQIEACLNSRPILALSNTADDPNYLSPAHFLIGGPLTSLPEPDLTDLPLNRLSRWQRVQSLQQQIWKRWCCDYLNTLQQRRKWTRSEDNLKPGVVVLVKEDNLPPLSWRLARVTDVHPGADGLVRVATIKTTSGNVKRPITKLIPLPISD